MDNLSHSLRSLPMPTPDVRVTPQIVTLGLSVHRVGHLSVPSGLWPPDNDVHGKRMVGGEK